MTTLGRTWSHLTLTGKVVFPLLIVLLVVGSVLAIGLALFGPAIVDILTANIGIVRFAVAATGILVFSIPAA